MKDLLRYTWVNRVAFLPVTTKSCKMATSSMQLCSFMFLKVFWNFFFAYCVRLPNIIKILQHLLKYPYLESKALHFGDFQSNSLWNLSFNSTFFSTQKWYRRMIRILKLNRPYTKNTKSLNFKLLKIRLTHALVWFFIHLKIF